MTSHSLAHLAIALRSMFSNCAVKSICSTIRYKLVSSEKSQWISFKISLIKSKNNNGPNVEPWGHLL